jgi:signal peptidase I
MKKKQSLKSEFIGILIVIFFALLFRSIVYEAYYIPSESMLPNLLVGDRIVINKYIYGISRYSFPFSPSIFNGRKFEFDQPKRGDVIVFETDKIYIKRLIGMPGDQIQVIAGTIYINGQQIPKTRIPDFKNDNVTYARYEQQLPNNKKYDVLEDGETQLDNTEIFYVPSDHYFFMGDNMDHSNDSRLGLGYIHKDNLLGRAEIILFSSSDEMYKPLHFLKGFRPERLFKRIQ